MKKRLPLVILPAVALILALLPWGAVLNFAVPDGEPQREFFSYFSLTPYGYANFGPLFTAILICALLVIGIVHFILGRGNVCIRVIAIAGICTSLLPPITLGISYFTFIGLAITICMAATTILTFQKAKKA